MSEFRWESVIPNFQTGDKITPFESYFKRQREADYDVDGGTHHHDNIEAYASVRRKNSKVGVYNRKGEQILPEEFDKCEPVIYNSGDFYVAAIKVQQNGLYGLYDGKGRRIVPTQYIELSVKDYFVVVMDPTQLYGAYLLDGSQLIECECNTLEVTGSLDEGLGYAIMRQGDFYGVRLETGKQIIPVQFKQVKSVGRGFVVSDEEYQGWYSRDGEISIPCMFRTVRVTALGIELEF